MFRLIGIIALVSWTGLFAMEDAEAMTAANAGLAIQTSYAIQEVQYYYGGYCKNIWKCGPYGCGWVQECYFPPSSRWRMGCPRGYTVQDGLCKPYRGY
jgi:hypothetical protein